MSYWVTVEREDEPIVADEWIAYARADPELEVDAQGNVALRLDGVEETVFGSKSDPLAVENPSDITLRKMAQIALALGGRVIAEGNEDLTDDLVAALAAELPVSVVEGTPSPPRAYSMRERFAVGDVVDHPKFGRGVVRTASATGIDVDFAGDRKKLGHGRG